jgi:hypothetical protein
MKISKLLELLNNVFFYFTGIEVLQDQIADTERNVIAATDSLLDDLTTFSGKINIDDQDNVDVLTEATKRIGDAFKKTDFTSGADELVRNLDEIQDFSQQIYRGVNKIEFDPVFATLSREKQVAVDRVIQTLLSHTRLNRDIGLPLRRVLFQKITSGAKLSEARAIIHNWIAGDVQNRGRISRHVNQIAHDAFARWDGLINQTVIEEFEMTGFRIVGSLINTSRQICIDMVNEINLLGSFAVDGIYRTEDIPKIIDIAQNMSGWDISTTPETYFINTNGYNCRHQFIGTFLIDDDDDFRVDSFIENIDGEGRDSLRV